MFYFKNLFGGACPQTPLSSSSLRRLQGTLRRQNNIASSAFRILSVTLKTSFRKPRNTYTLAPLTQYCISNKEGESIIFSVNLRLAHKACYITRATQASSCTTKPHNFEGLTKNHPIEIFQGHSHWIITRLFNTEPVQLANATAIAYYGPVHKYPFQSLFENKFFFSKFAYPHVRGDEWSLRAFASMPSTAIFLRAQAEIKNLLCEQQAV